MKPLFRTIIQGGHPGRRLNDFLTITLLQIMLFPALPLAAQPVISEFMADNDTVLVDEDGDFEDWIEGKTVRKASWCRVDWCTSL